MFSRWLLLARSATVASGGRNQPVCLYLRLLDDLQRILDSIPELPDGALRGA